MDEQYETKRTIGHYVDLSEVTAGNCSVNVSSNGASIPMSTAYKCPQVNFQIEMGENDEVQISGGIVTIYFENPEKIIPLFNSAAQDAYKEHDSKYTKGN